MKIDFKRHLLFAILISVVHIILTWICITLTNLLIIWIALSPVIIFGGVVYGLKDVIGFLKGMFSGLIYVTVGFVLYFIAIVLIWGWHPFVRIWVVMLGAACTGFLILAGVIGWINGNREHEIKLNELIDPTHKQN